MFIYNRILMVAEPEMSNPDKIIYLYFSKVAFDELATSGLNPCFDYVVADPSKKGCAQVVEIISHVTSVADSLLAFDERGDAKLLWSGPANFIVSHEPRNPIAWQQERWDKMEFII